MVVKLEATSPTVTTATFEIKPYFDTAPEAILHTIALEDIQMVDSHPVFKMCKLTVKSCPSSWSPPALKIVFTLFEYAGELTGLTDRRKESSCETEEENVETLKPVVITIMRVCLKPRGDFPTIDVSLSHTLLGLPVAAKRRITE
jgi:hypothetical protein